MIARTGSTRVQIQNAVNRAPDLHPRITEPARLRPFPQAGGEHHGTGQGEGDPDDLALGAFVSKSACHRHSEQRHYEKSGR